MTVWTLARIPGLAAVVLMLAAILPPTGPRAVLGSVVMAGALLYLAAGWLPRTVPVVVIGVRVGAAGRWWAWPRPLDGRW